MDEDGVNIAEEDIREIEKPLSLFATIIAFVESNGWFILIFCLVAYYVYLQIKKKLEDRTTYTNSHRDVDEDTALKMMQDMQAAREKQMAALEAAQKKYLEEKRLKEEKLAKEKAEEWERHKQGLGYHNKTKKPDSSDDLDSMGLSMNNKKNPKPRLRPADFNPLMGGGSESGGSCSWRPGQRGNAKRGG